MDTEKFVVLQPFASRVPFETWVIPKSIKASFGLISVEDSKRFAKVLRKPYSGFIPTERSCL